MQWAAGRQPWQPWLATLVANRRCYRENVYRSNRTQSPPSALSRNYDETRDTPLCAHSTLPSSFLLLTISHALKEISLSPLPLHKRLPHRVFILAHGQWSRPSRTSFRSNRFLQLQPSPVKRTGPDWTGQATPNGNCKSPRGLHISLMLLMRKGEERVSGALGVHRVRDTAMRARAIWILNPRDIFFQIKQQQIITVSQSLC